MSTPFPLFLYAIFVPVLAFFCLFPFLIAGLMGFGLWRFGRYIDGKPAQPQKLTITGFRRPARQPDPRMARLAAHRACVQAKQARTVKSASRLSKPVPSHTNPGVSRKRLAYPLRDADRYKYIEGQFSEFIHH